MFWQYIRKRLGIDKHEEKIKDHEREINKIRNHVVDIREKPRKKIIRKIEKKDERVDGLKERIDAFYEWGLKLHKAVDNNRKALEKMTDILSDEDFPSNKTNDPSEMSRETVKENMLDQNSFGGRKKSDSYREINEESIIRNEELGANNKDDKAHLNIDEAADGLKKGKKLWEKATDAQRQIIKKMYDLGYPVSYKELASEIGNTVSTIKSHINSMKDKDFRFRITLGPNSTKKYLLDDRLKRYLTQRLND